MSSRPGLAPSLPSGQRASMPPAPRPRVVTIGRHKRRPTWRLVWAASAGGLLIGWLLGLLLATAVLLR